MLNELLTLERSLVEYGFDTVARHPDVSQLLKGDVVRVRLGVSGAIDAIERLDGRDRPNIWTLRDGKHNGFPGLKTARGLLDLGEAALADHEIRWGKARAAVAKRAEILRVVGEGTPDPTAAEWPKAGHRSRIAERLETLRVLEADPHARAVPAAFARFLKATTTEIPLLHHLLTALLAEVRSGDDSWLDLARAAIVGPVSLAFDVACGFDRDAADYRQIAALGRALDGGRAAGRQGTCALTGRTTRLLDGIFPQPTLPSLGQTYLFSRNADTRALARYRNNGPASLPVDADLVARLSGALTVVTMPERQGKMWRLLPAEAGGGQDLFISFIASAPDQAVAASLTQTFEDEDTPQRGVAQVEAAAERVVAFWNGIATGARPGELARIMILRTVDPGNRKAAYDSSPTVQALRDAAQEWAKAMRRVPDWITFQVFDRKTRKARDGRALVQPPLALVPLSRKMYVRGGREMVTAPGISGAEALALFLGEGDRPRRARRILRLLLERHTGLLVGISDAKRRGTLKDFDKQATAREDALRSTAWVGALLAFIEGEKSHVQNAGFKLGQLLSAVDTVHAGYCAAVRGGDLPPTLVGNAVFAMAGRDPARALGVLQARYKPYHAWVDRLRRKPDKPESGPLVNVMIQAWHAKRLCEELHPALAELLAADRVPDEVFRAALLLGYVAGLKSEKKDKPASETQGVSE